MLLNKISIFIGILTMKSIWVSPSSFLTSNPSLTHYTTIQHLHTYIHTYIHTYTHPTHLLIPTVTHHPAMWPAKVMQKWKMDHSSASIR